MRPKDSRGLDNRPTSHRRQHGKVALGVCLGLSVIVLLINWQVTGYDFVNFDDDTYVYQNQHVRQGLTKDSISWSLTSMRAMNWHPITWISHMADVELYGVFRTEAGVLEGPGGHHLTNVLLHMLNAVLLFLALKAMTHAVWPAAWVAALFAVHPMHVESVAWVAERKDVLSGLFWILTMLAYCAYVRRPAAWRYVVVVIIYALGLTAKPMLVTLPFIFLLLDYWPLDRLGLRNDGRQHATNPAHSNASHSWFRGPRTWPLLVEKIPFLALAAASCVITFIAQQSGGAVADLNFVPFAARLQNAVLAYLAYLQKLFWPAGLAVLYPIRSDVSLLLVSLAAAVLVAVTIVTMLHRARAPWTFVGWLWFAGTLVPVIGIVQVGMQAYADRYTYLPSVGLFIAVAYGVSHASTKWPYRRSVLMAGSLAIVVALSVCAWLQTKHWKNGVTLFSRSIAINKDNVMAYNNRGVAYGQRGEHRLALEDFDRSIELRAGSPGVYLNRGMTHGRLGDHESALRDISTAIELDPQNAASYTRRGDEYWQLKDHKQAIADYDTAIRLNPGFVRAYDNLSHFFYMLGDYAGALRELARWYELAPREARMYNLRAWIQATCPDPEYRDGMTAVASARRACELSGWRVHSHLSTLAAAYAENDEFPQAVHWQTQAINMHPEPNKEQLRCLELYKSGHPYRTMGKKQAHGK